MLPILSVIHLLLWNHFSSALKTDVVVLDAGHDFQMVCKSPNPNALVFWEKSTEDRTVAISALTTDRESTKNIRISRASVSKYSLKVDEISFADNGNYTCFAFQLDGIELSATNSNGSYSIPCHVLEPLYRISLTVLTPPSILSTSSGNQTIQCGCEITLKCFASGYPKPIVYWKRQNDLPLLNYGESYPFPILRFKADSTNAGEYYCSAFNGVGNVTKWFVFVKVAE